MYLWPLSFMKVETWYSDGGRCDFGIRARTRLRRSISAESHRPRRFPFGAPAGRRSGVERVADQGWDCNPRLIQR
jgi:hypothetical protein